MDPAAFVFYRRLLRVENRAGIMGYEDATPSFQHLSDRDLLGEVARLAACEREATARLIACLAEVDARRLYLGEGCASLFTYCTVVLHLSEHAFHAPALGHDALNPES